MRKSVVVCDCCLDEISEGTDCFSVGLSGSGTDLALGADLCPTCARKPASSVLASLFGSSLRVYRNLSGSKVSHERSGR